MDEVPADQPIASPAVPANAGAQLRAAREAQGLSVADVGARTRIPLRHLEALEAGDYTGLPSPTYAVGFAKAYARAVGADEVAVAAEVRKDLVKLGPRQSEYVPYETADPSRLPSRGVAIAALGVALAVLILAGLWFGTGLFHGAGTGTVGDEAAVTPIASAPPAPAPAASPAAPTGGQVSFVANDEVWMRVYDADNKTLYLGTMKPGERFDVPADAKNPMINVGRPDKLSVTLNGAAVPALGTGEHAIKDVPVGAAALAARIAGKSAPAVSPASTPTVSTPTASTTTGAAATHISREVPRAKPRRRLTETQRANIESAANSTAP